MFNSLSSLRVPRLASLIARPRLPDPSELCTYRRHRSCRRIDGPGDDAPCDRFTIFVRQSSGAMQPSPPPNGAMHGMQPGDWRHKVQSVGLDINTQTERRGLVRPNSVAASSYAVLPCGRVVACHRAGCRADLLRMSCYGALARPERCGPLIRNRILTRDRSRCLQQSAASQSRAGSSMC